MGGCGTWERLVYTDGSNKETPFSRVLAVLHHATPTIGNGVKGLTEWSTAFVVPLLQQNLNSWAVHDFVVLAVKVIPNYDRLLWILHHHLIGQTLAWNPRTFCSHQWSLKSKFAKIYPTRRQKNSRKHLLLRGISRQLVPCYYWLTVCVTWLFQDNLYRIISSRQVARNIEQCNSHCFCLMLVIPSCPVAIRSLWTRFKLHKSRVAAAPRLPFGTQGKNFCRLFLGLILIVSRKETIDAVHGTCASKVLLNQTFRHGSNECKIDAV